MFIFYRLICVVIGYAFGLFQTSYIYGRMNHIDIRQYGSGNAGTTNAMRVLGKKAGIITYIGDMLKGVLAGVVIRLLCEFVFNIGCGSQFVSTEFVLLLYTGLGVVLGHNYPFYMGFKGGKGIAASSGAIIALFNGYLIIAALLTFIIVTILTKYVSLGSITMMSMFFVLTIVLGCMDKLSVTGKHDKIETYILAFILAAIAILKHRGNIKRLIAGTERKIGEKKDV